MTTSVLVNGAFGKMGQLVCKAIEAHPNLTLVGQTGRDYNLRQAIADSGAQVVVDFTHPNAVYDNTQMIIETGARPVIGTTGLKMPQIQHLQKLAQEKKIGGIIAPNFSVGAVLLMKYSKEIAKYMPNIEIIELHHPDKIDSPSGTALRTAELVSEGRKPYAAINPVKTIETVAGARGANYQGIPIHAIRLPGLLAHIQIIFGNKGETLTLKHDSIDRECFMPGICLACEKVLGLDKLVYGLEAIL